MNKLFQLIFLDGVPLFIEGILKVFFIGLLFWGIGSIVKLLKSSSKTPDVINKNYASNAIKQLYVSKSTLHDGDTEAINQLKYGFGSPGETSNAILKSFLQAQLNSPLTHNEELFEKIYAYRELAEQQSINLGFSDGNFDLISFQYIRDISKGCIATFTFLLMNADSKTFFRNVAVNSDLFDIVTKIVYDNSKDKVPKIVKCTYAEFNKICITEHEKLLHLDINS